MADTVRDVVIRMSVEQKDTELAVPDVSAFNDVASAVQQIQSELDSSIVIHQSFVDQLLEENEKIEDSFEDIDKQLAEVKEEMVDTGLKAAEGFRTAGDGAFTLARGVAFMSASSEEDMQVMIQNIAAVQAGFDTFRGTVDLVKGLVEGTRALSAATAVNATAQELAATATAAHGAAAAGATPAVLGLQAALGPIMAAVSALALVIGGAVAAYLYFSDTSEETADQAIEDADRIAEAAAEFQARMQEIQAASSFARERKGRSADLQAELDELEVLRDRLSVQEQLQQIEQRQDNNFGFRDADKLKEIASGKGAFGFLALQGGDSLGRQEAAAQELLELTQRQVDAEREKLGLIQSQEFSRQEEIEQQEKSLQMLREQLQEELNRNASLEERVGRLSGEDLASFTRLSNKASQGQQLSSEEVSLLEKLGGAGVQDYTSAFFQKQGQERGGAGLFAPFSQDVAGPQQTAQALQQQITAGEQQLQDLTSELDEFVAKKQEQEQQTAERIMTLLKDQFAAKDTLTELEKKLQEAYQSF